MSAPTRRRNGVATSLFVLASICAVACLIGFVMLALPSTRSFMNELRRNAENAEYPQFLAPGAMTLELPAGMIWVSFFTDQSLDGTRYQVPDSLVYDLKVTDASGATIPIEMDPAHRAKLALDSDDLRKAVLIGIAEIPHDGTYSVSLHLADETTNKAVAQLISMSTTERDHVGAVMTYLGMGVCGGGGAVFFGVLGFGARWAQRRAEVPLTPAN